MSHCGELRCNIRISSNACRQPTVAALQRRLAFTRASWDENTWRITLAGPGQSAGAPVRVIGSTRSELNAQFSTDGSRIVFESMRSGIQELWVADQDGRNALQLTSLGGRRRGRPTDSRLRSICGTRTGAGMST